MIVPGHLADTTYAIALLNQQPAALAALEDLDPFFLPVIVLGELIFGAARSERIVENTARIEALAARVPILPCDDDTAWLFGTIKTSLWTKGRPIQDNDVWIAALALQHDLTLVTRDSDFNHVDGLRAEVW